MRACILRNVVMLINAHDKCRCMLLARELLIEQNVFMPPLVRCQVSRTATKAFEVLMMDFYSMSIGFYDRISVPAVSKFCDA